MALELTELKKLNVEKRSFNLRLYAPVLEDIDKLCEIEGFRNTSFVRHLINKALAEYRAAHPSVKWSINGSGETKTPQVVVEDLEDTTL